MKLSISHISPTLTSEIMDDSLFHYTAAVGLKGIIQCGEMWLTVPYCSNDETELEIGEEFLTRVFSQTIQELISNNDPLIEIFGARGVNPYEYSEGFKGLIIGLINSQLNTYIACFCKADGKEDFENGLLSQWRAYGADGGYAIQFSKVKLLEEIEAGNKKANSYFNLQEVHYSPESILKEKLSEHNDVFIKAFRSYLHWLSSDDILNAKSIPNPLNSFKEGPLESLIEYLVYTKNQHFTEEKEWRLTLTEFGPADMHEQDVDCFVRGGLIVPYRKTPKEYFKILNCIEGVVVGPSPRINARVQSVRHLLRSVGIEAQVRPSRIPFTRL